MFYVSVIIDRKSNELDKEFIYTTKEKLQIGNKVIVPFGKSNQLITGWVSDIKKTNISNIKNLKEIHDVDETHSLTAESIRTSLWMAERYFIRKIDGINLFKANEMKRNPKEAPPSQVPEPDPISLTAEQQLALDEIKKNLHGGTYKTFLLNGITGSGKTLIYIKAIYECLLLGKSAILLVPEITLTIQTIEQLTRHFGTDNIAVLHSKISNSEKYRYWLDIKSGKRKIIIGARSAVFAMPENLGLIVIDEEHESSYKSEMTPKYDAIEVALKRMHDLNGTLVLASATPSITSTYRAKTAYYEPLFLRRKYNNVPLPLIKIVDMKNEILRGNIGVFSEELNSLIIETHKNNKQTILFLNRRGFAPSVICTSCGGTIKCPDCDISLTYHKNTNSMRCHFCGKETRLPKACPVCGEDALKFIGIGTEKLEEITLQDFPNIGICRLDLDTISKKGELERILNEFKLNKKGILIGTQIIAKGLDFDNVQTCGIVLADLGLNFPDFRSAEKTFSLISQVAGRAGRRKERGTVVLQTYLPSHYVINYAVKNNYEMFYEQEINIRRSLNYPPFSDFIQILFSGEHEEKVNDFANKWIDSLKKIIEKKISAEESKNIFFPSPAPISKIANNYRFVSYIKVLTKNKKTYWEVLNNLKGDFIKQKKVFISINVNPYSFL